MKKILFFETDEFTGATRVTHTLAKIAKKNNIVAFAKIGNNVRREIESAIEYSKPDILFSSFIRINPDVIEIGKQRGLYVAIRNDYNLNDVPEVVRMRAVTTYPMADVIIAQTEDMRQQILQSVDIDTFRVKVVDNPLDTEDIQEKISVPNPFNNNNFHFLWIGRKDPIKDLPTLQTAFELVHYRYPNTDLTFISEDPNPYRWMKYADCLVISSLSEASPNVLREALYIGTPVISTDCSQTVRQLLPPHNIVPVHEPCAMVEAMKRMVELKGKGTDD